MLTSWLQATQISPWEYYNNFQLPQLKQQNQKGYKRKRKKYKTCFGSSHTYDIVQVDTNMIKYKGWLENPLFQQVATAPQVVRYQFLETQVEA